MSIKKIITKVPSWVYYCLGLLLVGLFVFEKTFQLSLMGDEWQMIWIIKGSLETTGQWDSGIKLFHWQGYQVGAWLMNFITNYFGYDGKAVYIFSFITRFAATITLFYFFKKFKCSNTAAFLGSFLFIMTPIGLQTTDWAKNFTSYISISFFILNIYFIYKMDSLRSLFGFIATFYLSIYVNPIRGHGEIMTVALLLVIRLFVSTKNKKIVLFSILSYFITVILLMNMKIFGNTVDAQSLSADMLIAFIEKIRINGFSSFTELFTLIGKGLTPAPAIGYLGALMIILLYWKNYLFKKKYLIINLLIHLFIAVVFFNWFLSKSVDKAYAVIGLYFILVLFVAFIIEIFEKRFLEAMGTVLVLSLNVLFIITPWMLGRTDVTESTHRYLIYSALCLPFAIAFSLAAKNNINRKIKNIYILTVLLLLFAFIYTTKSLIMEMYATHNQQASDALWQQITPYFNGFDFQNRRPIILFESYDAELLHYSVSFGLGYHLGYLYNIWDEDKLPIPLDGIQTLKSMITDGKASKRYIGKEFIFPKEDAFYFKIEDNMVRRVDITKLFTRE